MQTGPLTENLRITLEQPPAAALWDKAQVFTSGENVASQVQGYRVSIFHKDADQAEGMVRGYHMGLLYMEGTAGNHPTETIWWPSHLVSPLGVYMPLPGESAPSHWLVQAADGRLATAGPSMLEICLEYSKLPYELGLPVWTIVGEGAGAHVEETKVRAWNIWVIPEKEGNSVLEGYCCGFSVEAATDLPYDKVFGTETEALDNLDAR